MPVVLDIAELVGRRGAPDAWIVDFTNPVGIVTQALLDDGHRAIGLCNVAIGFQRSFAERFGVEPEQVELEHVGLNHLTWDARGAGRGVDRLPELLAADAEGLAEMVGQPVEHHPRLARRPLLLPALLLPLRGGPRGAAGGRRARAGRGGHRDRAPSCSRCIATRTSNEKPALLDHRGGAYYSEAAAQLIASLHDGRGDVQVVDTRNDGAMPELPDDAVVEVAARIDRDGPHPIPVDPLEPDIRGLVQHAKAYEQLATQAAISGDRQVALRALLANPLVIGYDMAAPLLDALLEANRHHLPRFFASDG